MNFELEGKLFKMLELTSGEGRNGNWTKQSFVIETFDQFPKKVALQAWNDKVDLLKSVNPGDRIKVYFNPESREYNERWYTDLRVQRIETFGKQGSSNMPQDAPPPPDDEPLTPLNIIETDDLPF
jgi:hypothetical protein